MTRPGYSPTRERRNGSEKDIRALLAGYVKYAALVKYQEEALETEDLDRFEDLAEAREAIQEELGTQIPPLPDPGSLDGESRAYLEKVYESFRDAIERDTRLQTRLKKLKKEASGDLESVNGRDEQLKAYLKRDEVNTGNRKGRLNVRL